MFDLFRKKQDPAPAAPPESATPAEPAPSWTQRLKAGLGLSRGKLSTALAGVFSRRTLDDAALEELESALLMADVGVDATDHLLTDLRQRWKR